MTTILELDRPLTGLESNEDLFKTYKQDVKPPVNTTEAQLELTERKKPFRVAEALVGLTVDAFGD